MSAARAAVSTSPAVEPQEQLRARLRELGFDEVRFAALHKLDGRPLREWLAAGMHGDMAWMERSVDKRLDPTQVLAGARSIIMLGVNYWPGGELRQRGPQWARYALWEDYHDTIKVALAEAGRAVEATFGVGSGDYRYYVDTGPVIERGWAAKAGLGFVGKNAMLISRTHGNWLFLASILTTVALRPDPPVRQQASDFADVGLLCGKCTRCLDACPTAAFAAPGVVDARRCVSYQTIENKGIIPRELRAGIGRRIYGCDTCLKVCPWNRFAQAGRALLLAARHDLPEISLEELLALTPERFAEVFRRTPIKRLKLRGLLRNACVVAGNLAAELPEAERRALIPPLLALAQHELPLLRVHAVWALHRLLGVNAAAALLAPARTAETDADVLEEYTWWATAPQGVSLVD
ncbi:epoxyqueuosine reductase [Cephaloticoccus primus]|uniref:Epoxyqueuosine reductase n=1 Tax=Cephaloticoccus primus TaxID=1548207 RepID=A0A139STD5_9BACT|nr:tRNA epoxyqueuosine(34) reductase QueG [Cephaloticoccus primus]KXU37742.1 epoxyqueuosine reductase [Cephaloticoccus primus]